MISKLPGISDRDLLHNFISMERSKGLWSESDLQDGVKLLGFGENGHMRIPFDADVDAAFLMNAFGHAWKNVDTIFGSNIDARDGHRRDLKAALQMACQYSGNPELVKRYEQEIRIRTMDPITAYTTIGATRDMDDEMLMVIYPMRVSSSLCSIILPLDHQTSY